jgi:hypothetical protein
MNNYQIIVNGKYYAGESTESEQSDYGGNGWHVNNHGSRNKLLFTDNESTTNIIEGRRNLRSHIDRIMSRIDDGTLKADEIIIKLINC